MVVRSTFKALQLLPVLVFCCSLAVAATCPHLSSERAPLYQRSAFAHGYIHGYEQGFHTGNQDLQLARATRDISKSDEYREAAKDLRLRSEARDAFRAGYRNGLVVGYTDAVSDHSFRAIDEARIAAARLGTESEATNLPKGNLHFELGFMDGYGAGTLQGVGDGRKALNYRPNQAECGNESALGLGESYCAGYLRGFTFGYSDGYINHPSLMVTIKPSGQAVVRAKK